MQPTENELNELRELVDVQMKQKDSISMALNDDVGPSMIIDDFLYHGDLHNASDEKLLEKLNIRRIVNVCEHRLNQNILDRCHVLWINVEDDTYTDIERYFQTTNEFLHSAKSKGEKVLVHCHMGVSRSSTIVLAYLIKYNFDHVYKAYEYLLQRRCYAQPNLSFLLQLIRYDKELRTMNKIYHGPVKVSDATETNKELGIIKPLYSKEKRRNVISLKFPKNFKSFSYIRRSTLVSHVMCCCPFA